MIDKQSFSTKPGILGPHCQRNRTLAAYKRNLIFQIFFQLKGLESSLQTSGGGRVLALLLKMVPLGGWGGGTNSSWCILARNHGRWLRAEGCSPEAIPMDRAGSFHLDQIGSQLSEMTLPCWVSPPHPASTYRGNTACVSCPQRNRKGIKTQRGESFGVSWEFGQKLCARIFSYNAGN